MKKLSEAVGSLRNPQPGSTPKGVRVRAFEFGQTKAYERSGITLCVVVIVGWIVLVLVSATLAWIWTGIWAVAGLLYAATLWTAGDSDTPEAQEAQSTPGFAPGPIDQQEHDVINQHDH
jgi:hypothetical protein